MTTSIQLHPDIERRLDFLASETGRPKAFYIREMIEQGLEDVEDYYLAAEVLQRVRAGEETVHSDADVRKELGLDDRVVRDGLGEVAEAGQTRGTQDIGLYERTSGGR